MPKPKILGKLQMNFNREEAESVVTNYLPHLWHVQNQSLKYRVLIWGYSVLIGGFFFLFLKWAMKRKDKVINLDTHANLVLFDY